MQTVTEILIDFSSSMKEKLALTKKTLLYDIIPYLDYSARIGIKTFSATTNKEPQIKVALALSITNKEQIIKSIESLGTPDGNTPIAAAIKNSVNSLKEYLAYDKKIILITDGEENCGGDYTSEVNKARTTGFNCQIHIIGIGLTPQATKQAESISTLSNGSFSPIPYEKGSDYNQTTTKQHLTQFYSAIKEQKYQQISTDSPVILSSTESEKPKNEQIEKDDIQKEQNSVKENPVNDDSLKLIIEEIKEIKNQLKEIKKENKDILEIEEDIELNERIRNSSEEFLFDLLKKKYHERVKWLNEKGESYSDHDFEILDFDGSVEYFIECKGTPKSKSTFYLTKDEWRLFLNHTKNYQIYFVTNTFTNPTAIFIDNLLDWLLKGKIVPYLKEKQVIKEERVFLTLIET